MDDQNSLSIYHSILEHLRFLHELVFHDKDGPGMDSLGSLHGSFVRNYYLKKPYRPSNLDILLSFEKKVWVEMLVERYRLLQRMYKNPLKIKRIRKIYAEENQSKVVPVIDRVKVWIQVGSETLILDYTNNSDYSNWDFYGNQLMFDIQAGRFTTLRGNSSIVFEDLDNMTMTPVPDLPKFLVSEEPLDLLALKRTDQTLLLSWIWRSSKLIRDGFLLKDICLPKIELVGDQILLELESGHQISFSDLVKCLENDRSTIDVGGKCPDKLVLVRSCNYSTKYFPILKEITESLEGLNFTERQLYEQLQKLFIEALKEQHYYFIRGFQNYLTDAEGPQIFENKEKIKTIRKALKVDGYHELNLRPELLSKLRVSGSKTKEDAWYIENFGQVLDLLSYEEIRNLLAFWTGSSNLTETLTLIISPPTNSNIPSVPTASTCFNHLHLQEKLLEDYNLGKEYLLKSIEYGKTFTKA